MNVNNSSKFKQAYEIENQRKRQQRELRLFASKAFEVLDQANFDIKSLIYDFNKLIAPSQKTRFEQKKFQQDKGDDSFWLSSLPNQTVEKNNNSQKQQNSKSLKFSRIQQSMICKTPQMDKITLNSQIQSKSPLKQISSLKPGKYTSKILKEKQKTQSLNPSKNQKIDQNLNNTLQKVNYLDKQKQNRQQNMISRTNLKQQSQIRKIKQNSNIKDKIQLKRNQIVSENKVSMTKIEKPKLAKSFK